MKKLQTALVVAAAIIVAFVLGRVLSIGSGPGFPGVSWEQAQRTTLQLLRSESLTFLVTNRLVTTVLVESRQHNILFGDREGYLFADVNLLYGLNLEELGPDSVKREGEKLVVVLPEPKPLAFEVDPASLRFFSKRSGTVVIADWLGGRDLRKELEVRLRDEALKFLREKQMLPNRADILKRLDRMADLFGAKAGVKVEFR